MILAEQLDQVKKRLARLKPNFAGLFFYYLLPLRRKVIRENLEIVFQDGLTSDEKEKLIKCYYSHLGLMLKENLLLRFLSQEKLASRARVKGVEEILDTCLGKSGAIVITGHFGNWEFAPIAGMQHFEQFQNRLYFIRKMIKIRWLERLLFRRFRKAGLKVIPKKNSLDRICDALETQNMALFVLYKHAYCENRGGSMVVFFGRKAGT